MNCHQAPLEAATDQNPQALNSADWLLLARLPAWTTVSAKTATLTAISVGTTTPRPGPCCPPEMVTGCRVVRRPALTQSTHWEPTAASGRQSGQAGASHRARRRPVGR